jgi:solute:Na+ symporter, SSS family
MSQLFFYFDFVFNIVVDTAGSLYAGALLLQLVFPAWSITQIVVVLTIASGLYTMAGGLKAVMYTDLLQTILLMVGAVFITVVTFEKVGGWSVVKNGVPPEMLSLIRPHGAAGVPWTGLITGVPLLGFYFWCTTSLWHNDF